MDKIIIHNKEFKVEVERKKIKNIYLRFLDVNTVHITCPKYCSDSQVNSFIYNKSEWIYKNSIILGKKLATNSYSLDVNNITLFGKKYPLIVKQGNTNSLYVVNDIAYFVLSEDNEKNRNSAYFNYAKQELSNIVINLRVKWDDMIINDYRLHNIPTIKYKALKSRWGECIPAKNEIVLSTMLAHYPIEAINAVLLHEYVHLIVPNHSDRFYQIIYNHMPQYKQYHNLLK